MKNVTLKDVAKAAGVSYATVSRALSGSSQIGSETRERVLKLCDEMGYTTNFVARSMVTKRTNLIGLVVPSVDNQFMSELAYHAEVSARSHGYNIMLCDSGPDLRQEKTVVKLLLGRQVDGILIVPQSSRSYESLKPYLDQTPTVFLSENLRDQPQSYVAVDTVPLWAGPPGHSLFRSAAVHHPPAAGGGLSESLSGAGACPPVLQQRIHPFLHSGRLSAG